MLCFSRPRRARSIADHLATLIFNILFRNGRVASSRHARTTRDPSRGRRGKSCRRSKSLELSHGNQQPGSAFESVGSVRGSVGRLARQPKMLATILGLSGLQTSISSDCPRRQSRQSVKTLGLFHRNPRRRSVNGSVGDRCCSHFTWKCRFSRRIMPIAAKHTRGNRRWLQNISAKMSIL